MDQVASGNFHHWGTTEVKSLASDLGPCCDGTRHLSLAGRSTGLDEGAQVEGSCVCCCFVVVSNGGLNLV